NCSSATYYCYNSTPGFVPYPPPCNPGDTQGQPVVPAPTLPDPAYLAPSVPYYSAAQFYNPNNRGTWTEMYPGQYGTFHLSGGSGSCAFLNPGVYNWTNDYKSDATGSLLSNELKAPREQNYAAPGTTSTAGIQFWNMNNTDCAGDFSVTVTNGLPGALGLKHRSGAGNWGIELTSVRWCRFIDPTIGPNPCFGSPGSRRHPEQRCGRVSVRRAGPHRLRHQLLGPFADQPVLRADARLQLLGPGQRDRPAMLQQLPAAGRPAVPGERGVLAAVPAVHRWRRGQRELLPGLADPGQPELSVRDGEDHARCCAVLLPERLLLRPERPGRDVRVQRGAVQLDLHLFASRQHVQQHDERWRLHAVHRHHLHARCQLVDQRWRPLAACRTGDLLHGVGQRWWLGRHRLQPQ